MSEAIREVSLPRGVGVVADLVPVESGGWLLLGEDGRISRWDLETGEHQVVASTMVPEESGEEGWDGPEPRRRLHASGDGRFAGVVNDFGRFGEVLDLRTGEVTMVLDNDGYNEEHVPFSLAFARSQGRAVVIHRTEWNRLDVSDPKTGKLLTDRVSPRCGDDEGDGVPAHYLDYFHGALQVSPDGRRILDDGWVWHPVGFPAVWDLERWLDGNVWESEDGPSRVEVCGRESYWNHPMCWIDSTRVAIEGIGDDDRKMQAGVRVFDTTRLTQEALWKVPTAAELVAFDGPTGAFFSDGGSLFSSDENAGLSRWDPATGELLDVVVGFTPTRHHRRARQFLQVVGGQVRAFSNERREPGDRS